MTLILGGTQVNNYYSNNIFGLQGKVHLIHGNKGKFMQGSREVGTGGADPPRKSRQRNTMA